MLCFFLDPEVNIDKILPKLQLNFNELQGIIFQKMKPFITAAVRASHLLFLFAD
jgi:hypothetical protein